jgi:hypothetical protein
VLPPASVNEYDSSRPDPSFSSLLSTHTVTTSIVTAALATAVLTSSSSRDPFLAEEEKEGPLWASLELLLWLVVVGGDGDAMIAAYRSNAATRTVDVGAVPGVCVCVCVDTLHGRGHGMRLRLRACQQNHSRKNA